MSNLCFLSKLVEHCMLKQLINHCNTNCLIPNFQSAYRENYSTETSLIRMCNDILWSMEKQEITMMVTLSLSAAFDTVDHDTLISILQEDYWVTGKAQQWFETYLRPCQFKVCRGNEYSTPQQLPFSVPQGSCSGANVFTCYSALLDMIVPADITISGFADDHSLRKSFPAHNLGKPNCMQRELEHTWAVIKSWMDTIRMRLNTDKMEYITFGSKVQLQKISKQPLTTGNHTIQMSSDIKYLGGTLDSQLNFNKVITMKIWKVMSNFTGIKAIHKYLTKQACMTLVLSLCVTHLDYGNTLLYGLPKKSIKRLQMVQNMCSKLVLQCSKYSSATQALMDLHWLPIEQCIQYKILTITYRSIQNRTPKYIMDLLKPDEPIRGNIWSNESGLKLKVPPIKYNTIATRSFSYAAATLWNGLPTNIRGFKTLDRFKGSLKTYLYRKAFNSAHTHD